LALGFPVCNQGNDEQQKSYGGNNVPE